MESAGSATTFPDFTVMRGATREVSTVWDPPLLCICHPTVTFTNAGGVPQTVSTTVVIFPLDLLGLLIVVFAVRWRRRYQAAVRRAAEAVRWGPPPVAGSHA